MTQETLEEVAERLYPENWESIMDGQHDSNSYERTAFINGAKWQQERMFALVQEYNQMLIDPNVHEDHKEKSFKQWFEQFKKKIK